MKYAIALYTLALASIFIFVAVGFSQLETPAKDGPQARVWREKFANLTDATGSADRDSSFALVPYDRISVGRGIRLVHDPSLGRRAVLSGPAALVRHFRLRSNSDRISLDFDRPIRTDRYLELRINLQRSNSELLAIRSSNRGDSVTMRAEFKTLAPLKKDFLQLNDLRFNDPVRVDVRDLVIERAYAPGNLGGTARRAQSIGSKGDSTPTEAAFPRLSAEEFLVTTYPEDEGDTSLGDQSPDREQLTIGGGTPEK